MWAKKMLFSLLPLFLIHHSALLWNLTTSCVCSFIRSFICSFVCLFVCLFVLFVLEISWSDALRLSASYFWFQVKIHPSYLTFFFNMPKIILMLRQSFVVYVPFCVTTIDKLYQCWINSEQVNCATNKENQQKT